LPVLLTVDCHAWCGVTCCELAVHFLQDKFNQTMWFKGKMSIILGRRLKAPQRYQAQWTKTTKNNISIEIAGV
jgi:hypothetical protein